MWIFQRRSEVLQKLWKNSLKTFFRQEQLILKTVEGRKKFGVYIETFINELKDVYELSTVHEKAKTKVLFRADNFDD